MASSATAQPAPSEIEVRIEKELRRLQNRGLDIASVAQHCGELSTLPIVVHEMERLGISSGRYTATMNVIECAVQATSREVWRVSLTWALKLGLTQDEAALPISKRKLEALRSLQKSPNSLSWIEDEWKDSFRHLAADLVRRSKSRCSESIDPAFQGLVDRLFDKNLDRLAADVRALVELVRDGAELTPERSEALRRIREAFPVAADKLGRSWNPDDHETHLPDSVLPLMDAVLTTYYRVHSSRRPEFLGPGTLNPMLQLESIDYSYEDDEISDFEFVSDLFGAARRDVESERDLWSFRLLALCFLAADGDRWRILDGYSDVDIFDGIRI